MAVAAVEIAAAMTTNSVPLSQVEPAAQNGLFLQAMQVAFSIFKTVFLPHIVAGMVLFLLATYVTYHFLIAPLFVSVWLNNLLLILCVAVYGSVVFGYCLLTAFVCTLRKACVAWEEFLEQIFDKVKESIVAKLDHFQDGLPKDQAKIIIRGSVREVVKQFKPESLSAVGKWLVAFVLGCITLAMRSVMIANVVRLSGKTVNFAKLFAGKATLVGAIFLNLRFFATLLLIVLYGIGAGLIVFNFLVVWGLA